MISDINSNVLLYYNFIIPVLFVQFNFISLYDILKKSVLYAYIILYYNFSILYIICLNHLYLCNIFMYFMYATPFYVKHFKTKWEALYENELLKLN